MKNMKYNFFYKYNAQFKQLLKLKIFIFAFFCIYGFAHAQEKMKIIQSNNLTNLNNQFLAKSLDGDILELDKILAKGANINAKDSQGKTAIMHATYANNLALVKFLINKNADINIQDHLQNDPMLYASAAGYLKIVKALNETGKVNIKAVNRYGGTGLIPASEKGHLKTVEYLLKHTKTDIDHVNNLGWTALLEAIILGKNEETQTQIVKILLEHNADINIPDKNNISPLEHAKRKNYTKIIKLLEAKK